MYVLQQCYAKHRSGQWTGPMFVWQSGKQVDAMEIRLCLQRCLAMAGEDAVGLLPYSFRIGAVSETADRGASEAQI